MTGIIAAVLILISVVLSVMNGRSAEVLSSLLGGSGSAVELILKIGGTVCFFSGLFNVAKKAGITESFARLMRPLIRILMPSAAKLPEAEQAVCMNLASNVLGLGNAATPFGIKAVNGLVTGNSLLKPDRSLATFILLNTSSVTVIPTTVAAIRSAYGSAAPFDIIPQVLLTQTIACVVGVIAVRFFYK